MARQRGQWPVVVVNGTVAAVVLVLVAVLALVVNPPAPPGIAAFAPQASKPITKAPPNQSAQFGQGAGACGTGLVCAVPSLRPSAAASVAPSVGASPPAKGIPSALQCFTWPDGTVTQSFDPQSPPCIAGWDDTKGNGGSTSPGVTATEIRVALPVNTTSATWPGLKPIVDFFNTHFQLYGRQIRIVPFGSKQADRQYQGFFNEPDAQRADAAQVPALKVFASTDFVDPIHYSWSLPVFRDVLTKHKILSLSGGETTPYGTAHDLAKNAPYEWTYSPTIDTLMANVATMTCRQLVGKPAAHAPDASLRTKTRKFAVVIPTDDNLGGPLPGLSGLLRILDGCGVHSPEVMRYDYGADKSAAIGANFRKLSDDGVTSLIYFPQSGSGNTGPMDIAANVNYRPEWVFIGSNNYLSTSQLNSPPTETSGAFGVASWNKMPPLDQEMWLRAYQAGGGDMGVPGSNALPDGRAFYQEMLMLASGVQLAGPHLTPQSFAEGLHSTTFPNPGAGAAPLYQAAVGFPNGDPAMVHDFAGFWLDTRTTGQEVTNSKNLNTSRAACYVGLGRRWSLDSWPRTDEFYRGGCR